MAQSGLTNRGNTHPREVTDVDDTKAVARVLHFPHFKAVQQG